jgi:hypothetical protein
MIEITNSAQQSRDVAYVLEVVTILVQETLGAVQVIENALMLGNTVANQIGGRGKLLPRNNHTLTYTGARVNGMLRYCTSNHYV